MKASDRQELAKKLVPVLHKEFGDAPPEPDRPVLETLIFSVLLEDVPVETAEAAYDKLTGVFSDLNEIRVSTIAEIVAELKTLPRPELRAHRVRTVLQTVFEDRYEFTLEPVRKKTLDAAAKALDKIRDLSAFNRQYTLQHALRAHAVPVDGTTGRAAVWLGLAEGDEATGEIDQEAIADTLKSAIRKADAQQFNHLLRAFATDGRFAAHFGKKWAIPDGGYDPGDAPARLKKALKDPATGLPPAKPKRKAAAKPDPPAPKAGDAEPAAEESPATGSADAKAKADAPKKAPANKAPAKKAAAKKPPAAKSPKSSAKPAKASSKSK